MFLDNMMLESWWWNARQILPWNNTLCLNKKEIKK